MEDSYVCVLERESRAFVDAMDQRPFLGRVIRGEVDRGDYIRFLRATYHYVRWSGFLLAKTAEGLRRTNPSSFLLDLLDAKTEEEGSHDTWALSDLKNCGVNVELVRGEPPPPAVQAYVHWNSVIAEHGSPAFLGAAYTLEYISMQRAKRAAENLRARAAVPNIENALLFLDGHGDADTDHVARLAELLRRVLDPDEQADILLSSAVLRSLFPRFFQSDGCWRMP